MTRAIATPLLCVAVSLFAIAVGAAAQKPLRPTPKAATIPADNAACPAGPSVFGSAEKTPVSIEGKIYFLDKGTRKLPDFTTIEPHGSIYTAEWNITPRSFRAGFPGVTDRFEWFAIDYQGPFYVPAAGTYTFRTGSDDGAIFYIDDKIVVNSDGQHAWSWRAGKVDLTEGKHQFRLSYFQGPAASLGLELLVTSPGGKETVFRLQDYNKDVADSRSLLAVKEDDKEIHIMLGAEFLFDTGKYSLRPAASASLQKLGILLRSYPGLPILIDGHTDSVGDASANQTLSENRANAVAKWLLSDGTIPRGCITTKGYGEAEPVATNDTPEGRQLNRRVEIRLQKSTSLPKPRR